MQHDDFADRVRTVLVRYIHEIALGNCSAVAELAHCPVGVFSEWVYGKTKPQLEKLLRTWYGLALPVSLLLFTPAPGDLSWQEKVRTKLKLENGQKLTTRLGRERMQRIAHASLTATVYDAAYQKKILTNYLRAKGPAMPLHRIARSLGYANDTRLRRKFPELCQALRAKIERQAKERMKAINRIFQQALREDPPLPILEVCRRIGLSTSRVSHLVPDLCELIKQRRQQYGESRRAELLKKLKAALHESPPSSRQEIYARLGITDSIVFHNFPKLRRALIVRHRRYRHEQSCARQEAARREIRNIVTNLSKRGVCPAAMRVWRLAKKKSFLKWNAFAKAVIDARSALRP
jgi:hypothetical protein